MRMIIIVCYAFMIVIINCDFHEIAVIVMIIIKNMIVMNIGINIAFIVTIIIVIVVIMIVSFTYKLY